MKINEKTLVSYCVSNTPCDREGWLVKRGEVNKAFQRRWCVLRGNLLFYSERQGDREPLGVIILEGCTVELAEEETEVYAFKIVFHGDGKSSGRVYTLGTQTMEDLEAWMKLVACASYDYMKLMVVELQQQLAELEERERLGAVAEVAVGGPRVPPRNRANPFNAGGRERQGRSWGELHKQFGQEIIKDREEWGVNKDRGATVHMDEDNLLVVL
eukprot:TRINITY_DN9842_c0_g1_i1.p1 TRINITY_DN9842_c0_g1~~TRINITY_DN9842_c0_g1_i1.p1  ORF type:complete len:214 (-),score=96.65 TRINITY_DN9842_c0_g1_i1:574-1215(-)